MSEPKKSCTRCKNYRARSEFASDKSRRDGLHPHCKACVREYGLIRWTNPAYRDKKRIAANDLYERSSKQRARKWSDKLRSRYGMTTDEYAAMYESQDGRCAICDKAKDRLEVDHCHTTGRIRGLLCGSCNRAIGLFQDNVAAIIRASKYIGGCIHHQEKNG